MINQLIEVKPEELKSVAQKMDTQIEEYKRLYNAIYSEVDGLASAWKGADNIAYTTQMQGFKDDFETMATILMQYSEFLKKAAQDYQTTQDQIITEAKKLIN